MASSALETLAAVLLSLYKHISVATYPVIVRQGIAISVSFTCVLKVMEVLSVCCLHCDHIQACHSCQL